MKNLARGLMLLVLGTAAGVVLYPVGCVAYLYFSYIHDEVTEGSAYGFTIGQTKEEAYAIVGKMFHEGDIVHMQAEPTFGVPFPERLQTRPSYRVDQAQEIFTDFDHWSLMNTGPDLVIFDWHGDEVDCIRILDPWSQWPRKVAEWHPDAAPSLVVRIGDTYADVFATLVELDGAIPMLRLKTGPRVARVPVDGSPEEFRFVSDLDVWRLYLEEGVRDSIDLDFAQGRLARITRHRQTYEGT